MKYKVTIELEEDEELKMREIVDRITAMQIVKKVGDEIRQERSQSKFNKFNRQPAKKEKLEEKTAIADEEKKPGRRLGGRWSLKYDKCIQCGGTEKKHMGHGKCYDCYFGIHRPYEGQEPLLIVEKRCANTNCPFAPLDYKNDEGITRDGKWYCCEECEREVGSQSSEPDPLPF